MIESIFEKCLAELDFSNESRAVRQFLQCVVSQLNVKHVVIDNGLKYNFLLYVEVDSIKALDEIINNIVKLLDMLAEKSPENVAKYIRERQVIDRKSEKYIMLGKEFLIVKYVVK